MCNLRGRVVCVEFAVAHGIVMNLLVVVVDMSSLFLLLMVSGTA